MELSENVVEDKNQGASSGRVTQTADAFLFGLTVGNVTGSCSPPHRENFAAIGCLDLILCGASRFFGVGNGAAVAASMSRCQ